MPLALFESLAAIVVVLTLVAFVFAKTEAHLFRSYVALALSSYIGEETCIRFYRYYLYQPNVFEPSQWHFRLDMVPVLVPLIWPLVILSARQAIRALFPRIQGVRLALAVALLVCFDASLVEVLAVRATYWNWANGGHLGVPLIGILGWGYFTFGAIYMIERADTPLRFLAVPVVSFASTHGLILASWWGLFRYLPHVPRHDTHAIGAVVVVSVVALAIAIERRRRGLFIPLAVVLPRLIATALFFALLWLVARDQAVYWAHTACIAIPYFVATKLSRTAPTSLPA